MKQPILLLLCAALVSAQAAGQNTATRVLPADDSRNAQKPVHETADADGYVIGPEDVLMIAVFREEQLSSRVAVRADGKISMVLLDDVQASGLTPLQLKASITQGLKRFLTDPLVSVIPVEINSQYVYVIGSVNKPGMVKMGKPLRISELIVLAGGLAEFAKAEQIIIMRGDEVYARFRFNYKTFLEGKDLKQDIRLQSRDMVIVK
jgi:polysaccharide export outer membrane protein